MSKMISLNFNDKLECTVFSISSGDQLTFKLNRITAQQIAEALQAFSGVPSEKGVVYRNEATFGAYEVTPRRDAKKTGPVYFGTPKRRGAIKL